MFHVIDVTLWQYRRSNHMLNFLWYRKKHEIHMKNTFIIEHWCKYCTNFNHIHWNLCWYYKAKHWKAKQSTNLKRNVSILGCWTVCMGLKYNVPHLTYGFQIEYKIDEKQFDLLKNPYDFMCWIWFCIY